MINIVLTHYETETADLNPLWIIIPASNLSIEKSNRKLG